jgi:hypothetical protein
MANLLGIEYLVGKFMCAGQAGVGQAGMGQVGVG